MSIDTSSAAVAWRPDSTVFAPGDVIPGSLYVAATTKAGEVLGDAPSVRVAYLDDDTADFSAEGTEIDLSTPTLAEVTVYTAKVSQLLRVSNEQYAQPGTAQQLSESVARALTRRADAALVSETAPTPPAQAPAAGLLNYPDVVDGGEISGSLDALIELLADLESNLSVPSHILVGPRAWAAFRQLKVEANSNASLIGAGTQDAAARLLSLPVLVNVALPDDGGLVIDRSVVVSAYGPIRVDTSMDRYFEADSVAIRATWRVGHALVRPERCGKFTIAAVGGS
jgi:HK97 family phage major capsid protein